MRTLKYIVLALLSMITVTAVFVVLLSLHYNLINGDTDFMSLFSVSNFLQDIIGDDTPGVYFLRVVFYIFVAGFNLVILMIILGAYLRLYGRGATSTQTDYVHSGSFSGGDSDGGFSD